MEEAPSFEGRTEHDRMRKAKSIEDIYHESAGAQLVISNQPPLATALNRLADRPMLGRFAVTPRDLARRMAMSTLGEETWSDARLIAHIAEATGLEMRYVHGEIENLRDIRRHTAQVERHLDSRDAELVWKHYSRLPTVERAMERFPLDFFHGIDVAVVALDLFDELDKHVLPPPGSFREVSPWKEGSYEMEEILDLGNERLIGRHVADLVDEGNMNSVAVVLDLEGSIDEAVRSSLYRKGIPFQTQRQMRDLPGVRDALRFLDFSLGLGTARMGDLKRLVRSIDLEGLDAGGLIFRTKDDARLIVSHAEECGDAALKSLCDRMASLRGMPLAKATGSLLKGQELGMALRLLRELDLSSVPLDEDSLDVLRYGVDRLSEEMVRDADERHGVVLVDCRSSAYVDRPVVFHLGLGNEWARSVPRRPHIDSELVTEKDMQRFEILLQQGERRIYMTSKVSKGRRVLPCVYFNRSLGRPVMDFDDIIEGGGARDGRWLRDVEPSPREPMEAEEPLLPRAYSPSALNVLLSCAKKYQLRSFCQSPENIHAFRGTLVHSYAELIAHHPRYASTEGMEQCLDLLLKEQASLSHKGRELYERGIMRGLMENAAHFMEHYSIAEEPPRTGTDNPLFAALDLKPTIGNTEKHLEDRGLMLRGFIDLLADDSLAVDHKTGAPKSAYVVARSIEGVWDDYQTDCQAIAYLALLSRWTEPGKETALHYNHMRQLPEDQSGYELGRHRVRVLYTGRPRAAMFDGDDPWIMRILGESKTLQPLIEEVGSKELCSILRSLRPWQEDLDEEEAFHSYMAQLKGKTRKNSVARKVFDAVLKQMRHGVCRSRDAVIITSDVMERFLATVKECHRDVGVYKREGFPADPRRDSDCKRCDYQDVCMEALE